MIAQIVGAPAHVRFDLARFALVCTACEERRRIARPEATREAELQLLMELFVERHAGCDASYGARAAVLSDPDLRVAYKRGARGGA